MPNRQTCTRASGCQKRYMGTFAKLDRPKDGLKTAMHDRNLSYKAPEKFIHKVYFI